MASPLTVIHLPQKLSKIASRTAVIFLENVIVPALLIAFFAAQGYAVVGVLAVFVWRALFFATRWRMFRIIPVTSVLTFAVLSARTGLSFTMGSTESSAAALTAYILPAAAISALLGLYFIRQGFSPRPLTLRLASDFIAIPEECEEKLLPFARAAAFAWGGIHVMSGLAGAFVVLSMEEAAAGLVTSALSIATPLTALTLTLALCSWLAMRSGVRLSLREEAVVVAPATH